MQADEPLPLLPELGNQLGLSLPHLDQALLSEPLSAFDLHEWIEEDRRKVGLSRMRSRR
jgi:hypothetical protein